MFSKANLGSRKLRMVLIAQIVGTSIAGIGAWLGLDNDHLKMVLDFLSTTLFAGVGGNLFEHVTDTIKTVRAKKEEVEPT